MPWQPRPPNPLRLASNRRFLGTFFFQLLGGTQSIALLNGLVLAVCIFMTAKVSGGQLNPAVSYGLLAAGEMPASTCVLYCLVPLLGATLAALFAGAIYVEIDPVSGNATAHGLQDFGDDNTGPGCRASLPAGAYGAVFFYEMVGTYVLVGTVCATAVAKQNFGDMAPLAIGLAVAVAIGGCVSLPPCRGCGVRSPHAASQPRLGVSCPALRALTPRRRCAQGTLTGGFFNPARFFGPAIVFGCNLKLIWLYWGAQLLGGTLAGASHRLILVEQESEPLVQRAGVELHGAHQSAKA
jgi:glycerol uptake facilitator-like aquaporin